MSVWYLFRESSPVGGADYNLAGDNTNEGYEAWKKLVISYAVLLILLVAGTAVSIISLVSLNRQIEIFYDGPFLVKGSANIINSNFERMQKAVYRTIVNQDEALISEAVADAKASAQEIQNQIPDQYPGPECGCGSGKGR